MSAAAEWKPGNPRALLYGAMIAPRPRGPVLALEARGGLVRALILCPDGAPAQVKLGELEPDGSGVWVPVLGKRTLARPFGGHPQAPGCRYVVTMPPRQAEE